MTEVDVLFNTPASEGGRETWAAALLDLLDAALPPDDDLPARARLGEGAQQPYWELRTSHRELVLVIPPRDLSDPNAHQRRISLGHFSLGHTSVRARKGATRLGWDAYAG